LQLSSRNKGAEKSEVGSRRSEDRGFWIFDFETGNPPEGWESEGQFRNLNPMLHALCALLYMLLPELKIFLLKKLHTRIYHIWIVQYSLVLRDFL